MSKVSAERRQASIDRNGCRALGQVSWRPVISSGCVPTNIAPACSPAHQNCEAGQASRADAPVSVWSAAARRCARGGHRSATTHHLSRLQEPRSIIATRVGIAFKRVPRRCMSLCKGWLSELSACHIQQCKGIATGRASHLTDPIERFHIVPLVPPHMTSSQTPPCSFPTPQILLSCSLSPQLPESRSIELNNAGQSHALVPWVLLSLSLSEHGYGEL